MTRCLSLLILFMSAACNPTPDHTPPEAPPPLTTAAPSPPPEPEPPTQQPSAPVLAAAGYDTIRVGQPPTEATGYDLADDGAYQDACRIFMSPRLPGLAVMVEEGIVTRLTLYAGPQGPSTIRTERGIGVGSTEAEVRAAYAPLVEQPHKYSEPPAKDLFFEEGLRFEIGPDGRVTELHAGRMPALGYVEGCS